MSKQNAEPEAIVDTPETDPEVTADVDVTPDDTEEPADDDQGEDSQESANAEAAKYRRRLREAEGERDQLRDQLAAQHRAVIDWRATTAQAGAVDPQLLDAAGITVDELLDDTGHLDMAKVDQFIDSVATKFRVQRHAKPNPQQGNPSQARPTGTMADLFRDPPQSR